MRLYAAEARDRWRLARRGADRGARRRSPTSRPSSSARRASGSSAMLADLRRWTEFDRGGHFAAFEEPELLGGDLLAFLAEL